MEVLCGQLVRLPQRVLLELHRAVEPGAAELTDLHEVEQLRELQRHEARELLNGALVEIRNCLEAEMLHELLLENLVDLQQDMLAGQQLMGPSLKVT